MHKQPKKKFQIFICAFLLTVALLVYITVFKSPEDHSVKDQDSGPVSDIQSMPEDKSPLKAAKPVEKSDKADWLAEMEKALDDPDVSVRMRTIRQLRNIMTPEAVDLLAMFLDDKESVLAEEAVDALGHIAQNSDLREEVLAILIDKAKDEKSQIRGPALLTAAVIGDQASLLPVIGSFIEEQDESAWQYATQAIGFVNGPEAVPFLKKILAEGDINSGLQRNIYTMLMKSGSEEALQILKDSVFSEDWEKQENAVTALSISDTDACIEILSDGVKSKTLGDEALSIIATSTAASEVFGNAFQSDQLTSMDKRNLLKLISENTVMAPSDVANQVAETIQPLLNSPDIDIQKEAINVLRHIGASENQAEVLAPKLEEDSPILQEAALEAYIIYANPNNYKPLIKLWYNKDEKIRRTAFFISSAFVNHSDMEDLVKATEHPDEFIADGSARVIEQLKLEDEISSQ